MIERISLDDVERARARIRSVAIKTPLVRNAALDALTGGAIWLKAECLQRTGSFKFRGAFNRLSALGDEERRAGIVAFSSGNHAQGVALAAKLLGIPATIVMPVDAPQTKLDGTRAHGATIVSYDRLTGSREDIAADIAAKSGAIVVPSFNDPYIMAGQGTIGLEVADRIKPDIALVCCGGGGLSGGISVALPNAEMLIVEPVGYDDVTRSLADGEIRAVADPVSTMCDALQTLQTSPLNFAQLVRAGARGISVSDEEVMQAVRFAFEALKLVVEPGGAVALAAALSGKADLRDKTVLVTLSGGNVDREVFAHCLREGAPMPQTMPGVTP